MHALLTTTLLLSASFLPSRLAAEPQGLTIEGATVRIDPDLPVLTCTVIQTSGDPAVDDRACAEARLRTGIGPPSMGFRPDHTGRFVSCFPVEGEGSPAFEAQCAADLERIRNMRAMVAIDEPRWLRPADIRHLPIPAGRAMVRVGINERGRPYYCILVEPREVDGLEQALCSRMMARARFRPARDMQGRTMPSGYQHELRWRTE